MTKPHNRRTIIAYASVLALAGGLTWSLRDVGRAKPLPGWIGRVEKVIDGDTVWIRRGDVTTKFRLHAADAPEHDQPFGPEAKDWIAREIIGSDVRVVEGTKSYDRIVADVYLGRRWINKELIERGYAMLDRRYSHDKELIAAEADAKAARRGLWADPSPEEPWLYRKQKSK